MRNDTHWGQQVCLAWQSSLRERQEKGGGLLNAISTLYCINRDAGRRICCEIQRFWRRGTFSGRSWVGIRVLTYQGSHQGVKEGPAFPCCLLCISSPSQTKLSSSALLSLGSLGVDITSLLEVQKTERAHLQLPRCRTEANPAGKTEIAAEGANPPIVNYL